MGKKNPDKSSVKCNVCGLKRMKIRSLALTKGGRSLFTDELGRYWNGNVCPSCNVQRISPYCKRYRKVVRMSPEEFLKKVQERYADIMKGKKKSILKRIVHEMAEVLVNEDDEKRSDRREEVQRHIEENLLRHANDYLLGDRHTESVSSNGASTGIPSSELRSSGEGESILGTIRDDRQGNRLSNTNSEGTKDSSELNPFQTTETSKSN